MATENVVLPGKYVRLETLGHRHIEGLMAAAGTDPSLYRWTPVPRSKEEAASYIDTALAWLEAGTAVPFANVRVSDGLVLGSTRFFNMERFPWPQGHARYDSPVPDVCEIGYTWLTLPAIRTAANTEAKLLMLTHAFEVWNMLRVCFHTDARNERSRAALERIGGKFEGILRAHRIATDHTARDSARYSITTTEWPGVKSKLRGFLDKA